MKRVTQMKNKTILKKKVVRVLGFWFPLCHSRVKTQHSKLSLLYNLGQGKKPTINGAQARTREALSIYFNILFSILCSLHRFCFCFGFGPCCSSLDDPICLR